MDPRGGSPVSRSMQSLRSPNAAWVAAPDLGIGAGGVGVHLQQRQRPLLAQLREGAADGLERVLGRPPGGRRGERLCHLLEAPPDHRQKQRLLAGKGRNR